MKIWSLILFCVLFSVNIFLYLYSSGDIEIFYTNWPPCICTFSSVCLWSLFLSSRYLIILLFKFNNICVDCLLYNLRALCFSLCIFKKKTRNVFLIYAIGKYPPSCFWGGDGNSIVSTVALSCGGAFKLLERIIPTSSKISARVISTPPLILHKRERGEPRERIPA